MYQILTKRLPKHFDIYLFGHIIGRHLYVYRLHKPNKYCIFFGTLNKVLDKLCDKEIIKNATKRKVTKNGKPVTDEDRVRIRWNKRRRVDRIVG